MSRRPGQLPSATIHRHEDLIWMADTGECATGAAARLGLSRKALERWCRAHDPKLWQRLLAREPRDVNLNWGNQWGAA